MTTTGTPSTLAYITLEDSLLNLACEVEESWETIGSLLKLHASQISEGLLHRGPVVADANYYLGYLREEQGDFLRALNEAGYTDHARTEAQSHVQCWAELSRLSVLCGLPETTTVTIEDHRVSAESILKGLTP